MSNVNRQTVRLALNFSVAGSDLLVRSSPLDLGPGLVFLAINWENLHHQVSPLDPRAPVSAYKLARDLRLPYETCRRYANQLVEIGWCDRLPGGFIAASRGAGQAAVAKAAPEVWEIVRDYVAALQRAGVALPVSSFDARFDVTMRVALEASRHFLNLLRIGCDGWGVDANQALMMYAVMSANTAHVTAKLDAQGVGDHPDAPTPDRDRRAVSAYRLAQNLRTPYETVRRHVRRLVQIGLLVDGPDGGVFSPASAHARPEVREGREHIVAEVRRFLDALSQIAPLPLDTPRQDLREAG